MPPQADARLSDKALLDELAWAKSEIASTGCVCCHDSRINPPGQWDINAGPLWLDTLSDTGLALFGGYADSSVLGAYPAAQNHGFDREQTGIMTVDTARMKKLVAAELTRRGITEEKARAVPPFGGPIYTNSIAMPTQCGAGEGVEPDGRIVFRGGSARYVYILEPGSRNPGVPPNFDRPTGTRWRLDVLPSADALPSGLLFGKTPKGSYQDTPETGAAAALEVGKTYHLAVLKDVGLPLANCLFTFGSPVQAAPTPVVSSAMQAQTAEASVPPASMTPSAKLRRPIARLGRAQPLGTARKPVARKTPPSARPIGDARIFHDSWPVYRASAPSLNSTGPALRMTMMRRPCLTYAIAHVLAGFSYHVGMAHVSARFWLVLMASALVYPACSDDVAVDSAPDAASEQPVDGGAAPDVAATVDATVDAGKEMDAMPEPPGPLAFVFAGESNSGGIALNSEATAAELAPRPAVQIMNLYSGTFAFEPLDIGFNNIVDHQGISTNPLYVPTPPNTIVVHGMELGLANAVEASKFAGETKVYLIKTGQGGSRIAQWDVGGAYWNKFLERTNAAKAALPKNTRWIVWYSQGINDAVAGTPIASWTAATIAHVGKIKAQLPGCQIVFTEFQSMPANAGYPEINTAIQKIVAADPDLASVSSVGAGTDGANHWSYAGYRNVLVPALVAKNPPLEVAIEKHRGLPASRPRNALQGANKTRAHSTCHGGSNHGALQEGDQAR